MLGVVFLFFKQKTSYEVRIMDWSSDVCSSDLRADLRRVLARMLEGGGAARHDRETECLKRPRIAARQPRPRMVMLEIGARPALAEGAEGVDITLARAAPADELDADLEDRHRRAHEPGLVEAQHVVEILDVRLLRSPPPDHSDRLRLDKPDYTIGI